MKSLKSLLVPLCLLTVCVVSVHAQTYRGTVRGTVYDPNRAVIQGAQVTVTNCQRLFKFQNISAQNGDFSVDYIFPDDGTHQVLLRLDKNDSINVASFNVFVPHQSPPSLLDNQGNLIIGIGILAAVGAITIIILKKR